MKPSPKAKSITKATKTRNIRLQNARHPVTHARTPTSPATRQIVAEHVAERVQDIPDRHYYTFPGRNADTLPRRTSDERKVSHCWRRRGRTAFLEESCPGGRRVTAKSKSGMQLYDVENRFRREVVVGI